MSTSEKIKHIIEHEVEFLHKLRERNKKYNFKMKNFYSIIKLMFFIAFFGVLFYKIVNPNIFLSLLFSLIVSILLSITLEVLSEIKDEENNNRL